MSERIELLETWQARVNITWQGQNGDLPDAIAFDASDAQIRTWVSEALAGGNVVGVNAGQANLRDFVVDRFMASDQIPYNRVFVRPKTPFG